jgi:integrase
MLSVYTRHYPPCPHHDLHHRRCHCPKWLGGVRENRGFVRFSAHTRSWATAEVKAREMERKVEEPSIVIASAVTAYLNDEDGRKLQPETVRSKRAFLEGKLLPWCGQRRLLLLDQLRLPELREFRQTWDLGARTAGRAHQRLRTFLAFCVANGWLPSNPSDMLRRPLTPRTIPTNYFSRREFQHIVAATKRYEYGGGFDCWYRARRLLTLVLLMRWSGLCIKDAVSFSSDGLDQSGALFLRRAKTGVAVFVPLPPLVVTLLRSLPPISPSYFFWSGNGKLSSALQGYHRSFRKLFRVADIRNPDGTHKPCRPHMFRDTFAVEMLLARVPIDQVSVLLGHRSVKMTEKHYLPWVKARQRQLTASVRQAWFPEVRQSPLPQGREPAGIQTSFRAAPCHPFKLHVLVSPAVAHPFLLYL